MTQTSPEAERLFAALLDAIKAERYDDFVGLGSHCFQHAISRETFDAVVAHVSAFLKQGYEARYLGMLKRKEHQIHLWKISYADGGDEHLAHLTFHEGKATGFWLT